jgi:hypothetical protein
MSLYVGCKGQATFTKVFGTLVSTHSGALLCSTLDFVSANLLILR